MRRYVNLADDLRRCRYFTEQERSVKVTFDGWDVKLPDAGATRDMLGLLRQLFGDGERASFTAITGLLKRHADGSSAAGQELSETITTFENVRQGVLDSWDAQPGGIETSPQPPLTVFLDWMYGEFLHSDADKAERIEQLDTRFRLYEMQFHWVSERLAILFTSFARLVDSALATAGRDGA
jgi:hypothetical protein